MIYQVKRADVPGEPRKGFEQSFASLAYSYIADRAPALMPYLVGFQLLEKSPDNRKAAGIFGFLVDGEWLDIPVFFIEGSIKGHGLLYLRNKNQFVPAKENWINYLIGRKPSILGRMEPKTQSQLGARYPELYRLRVPPAQLKYSSLRSPAPWAKTALSKWARLIVENVPAPPDICLVKVASRQPEMAVRLAVWYGQYPAVAEGLDKFYDGRKFLVGLLKQARWQCIRSEKRSAVLQDQEEDEVPSVPPARKQIRGGRSSVLNPDVDYYVWLQDLQARSKRRSRPGREKASRDLEIYRSAESLQLADNLSDEERRRFIQQGYLIRDRRPFSKCAAVLDEKKEFSTSGQTGTQKVLFADGSVRRCFVANKFDPQKPALIVGGLSRDSDHLSVPKLVVDFNAPGWRVVRRSKDLVVLHDRKNISSSSTIKQHADGGEFPSSKVVSPREMKEGAVYLIALRRMQDWTALYPLSVQQVVSRDPVVVIGKCDCSSYDPVMVNFVDSTHQQDFRTERNSDTIVIRVPARAAVVELLGPDPCPSCGGNVQLCSCPSGPESSAKKRHYDMLPLGDFSLVSEVLTKKSSVIKAASWAGGNEFLLSGCNRPLSPQDAVIYLVTRHQLREPDAKWLLAKASALGEYAVRIKRAQAPLEDDRSYGPQLWPEDIQMEDQVGYEHSVPARSPVSISSQVPGLSAAEKFDPFAHDPRNIPPPPLEAIRAVQQAAQLGQKDIFDSTVLAAMLRTRTDTGMVDQYIGDLLRALDRLGRILFKMYWHYAEFEERYGKKDMPELEDTLLYSFETLGDLTLFLMRKAVSPFSLGEENAGPSLDESSSFAEGES